MPEICLGESFNRGDLSGRALTAGAVVGGGAGYTDGQSVTGNADDGSGYGATCTVTVVGGAVTAVTIVAGGYGYGAGETIKIEGAGGAGATGTATVSAGDWNPQSFPSGIRVSRDRKRTRLNHSH